MKSSSTIVQYSPFIVVAGLDDRLNLSGTQREAKKYSAERSAFLIIRLSMLLPYLFFDPLILNASGTDTSFFKNMLTKKTSPPA